MAAKNEAVSSLTDLVTKLDAYMQTRGWTADHLDVAAVDADSGEWAMTLGNIRFAAKWDALNSPTKIALYQYSDQAYVIADRPWGQDNDSGNGAASALEGNIEDARHVVVGATPIQYWAFDSTAGNFMHIVVESSTGVFCHFGFGELDKRGDWTGGEYVYGQFNNNTGIGSGIIALDGASFTLDGFLNDGSGIVDAELYAATIRAVGLPNQVANGMWMISAGGSSASPQSTFGSDRQSNDGSSSDTARHMFIDGLRGGPWPTGFCRQSSVDLSGEVRLWPIAPRYWDNTDGHTYGPMGFMHQVFGCSIAAGWAPGTTFTDENGDTYAVFPAEQRWVSGADQSGYLGIAYRTNEPAYVDPGLPSAIAASVTGWWSSRSADDYTVDGGGEITQLDDKTGNGADLNQEASAGPTLTEIDGRNWITFGSVSGASGDRIGCSASDSSSINPGAGDVSVVLVYRNSSGNDVCPFYKAGAAPDTDNHFGMRFNLLATNNINFRIRDDTFRNSGHLDDTLATYADGSSQIVGFTYDDSIADEFLFGDNNDPTTAVDSDLAWASGDLRPYGRFMMGAWGTGNAFDGEIAELIFFDVPLTGGERTDLWDYLKTKWGIS